MFVQSQRTSTPRRSLLLIALSVSLATWTTAAAVAAPRTNERPGVLLESAQNPMIAERTKGDPDAPVTIYEVTDFACPWCREFYRLTLPSIEREYIETGKAKLVFVNLPIPELHPNAPAAHEFAMCAAQQDRFWPVHDLLYQHQAVWAPLEEPREYFTLLADSADIDIETLDICFDTGATRWLVQQEAESVAQRANITSTPSFIMETVVLVGFQPMEEWRPLLDSLFTARTGGGAQ